MSEKLTSLKKKLMEMFQLDQAELDFGIYRIMNEKAWYNLSFSKENIESILKLSSWYILKAPKSDMEFDNFNKVYIWQEMALTLMKKYLERFYNYKRNEWESQYREMVVLDDEDPNMVKEYTFYIHESMPDKVNMKFWNEFILDCYEGKY